MLGGEGARLSDEELDRIADLLAKARKDGRCMIKVSLLVLAGLTVARLLRSQSAALRHWVLWTAIACAAAVPAVELIVPGWNLRPLGASAARANVRSRRPTVTVAADIPAARRRAARSAVGTRAVRISPVGGRLGCSGRSG